MVVAVEVAEAIEQTDIAHQIQVLALVKRLSEQRGIGVVVVLHDINMAGRFCDELIARRDGRLLASGPASEMTRARTLAEIYGIPMTTLPHPQCGSTPNSFPL